MDIVLSDERGEDGRYPGDQLREGWAHFCFGVPTFKHHFIPVSERNAVERPLEGKLFLQK